MTRGSRRVTPVLVLAFLVLPILEIFLLIRAGQAFGAWWTLGLLILSAVIGAWLVRHEGAKTFAALRTALNSGRMPGRELADGALILVAGTLMLTPGFLTDGLGLLIVLPPTRPVFRSLLTRVVTARVTVIGPGGAGGFGPPGRRDEKRPGPTDPTVVRGEVVDE